MARFEIIGPDGGRYQIEAPDGASESDVMSYVQQNISGAQAKQPDASMLESFGRGALQGATFGFSDELYGAGKGAYDKLFGSGDFTGTYAKERDAVREANKRAQEANPGSYFTGEIGGGLALPMGAARAGFRGAQVAADATLGARSLASAKAGGKVGALYGLGVGEGDAGNQALSTLGGVAGGAAFGGAVPAIVDVASAAARTPAQLYRMARDPQGVAVQKYAEAMGRDASGNEQAVQNVARSLDDAEARGDPTAMLADYGGENVKGLVRAAADMPNDRAERFNQFLNRRQQTQPRRLERAVNDGLGQGEADTLLSNIEGLIKVRDQRAQGLFKRAFGQETPMTPQLDSVLRRPTMVEMRKQVERRLADEGQPIGLETRSQMLHRLKLEIDEQIGMSKRAEKMGNRPTQGWDTRTLTILKRDLLNAIDNKPYKYALNEYAGPSAMVTAAEDGLEEALKISPELIASKLKGLTASEQAAWRQGAARALIDKIRTGNFFRDRTKTLFDTPDMQMRLKQIFPDNKSRGEFMRAVASERRKTATRANVQGNSKTARYLTQAQEAGKAAAAASDAAGAVVGKPASILKVLERGYNLASGLTPDVAASVLDLAMTRGGASARGISTQAIQDALAQAQARKLMQSLVAQRLLPAPAVLSAEASQGRQ